MGLMLRFTRYVKSICNRQFLMGNWHKVFLSPANPQCPLLLLLLLTNIKYIYIRTLILGFLGVLSPCVSDIPVGCFLLFFTLFLFLISEIT